MDGWMDGWMGFLSYACVSAVRYLDAWMDGGDACVNY